MYKLNMSFTILEELDTVLNGLSSNRIRTTSESKTKRQTSTQMSRQFSRQDSKIEVKADKEEEVNYESNSYFTV
jgi:hypothetical protein